MLFRRRSYSSRRFGETVPRRRPEVPLVQEVPEVPLGPSFRTCRAARGAGASTCTPPPPTSAGAALAAVLAAVRARARAAVTRSSSLQVVVVLEDGRRDQDENEQGPCERDHRGLLRGPWQAARASRRGNTRIQPWQVTRLNVADGRARHRLPGVDSSPAISLFDASERKPATSP